MLENNKLKKRSLKIKFKQFDKFYLKLISNFKILNFRKKKWLYLLKLYKISYIKTKYQKYKIIDQNQIVIHKKNKFELNYKKYFKKLFIFSKIFKLFFGNLKRNYYKKLFLKKQKLDNLKIFILKNLENRLDYILFKSKFYLSLRATRIAIFHGHISVNAKIVKNCSFLLKSGDFINIFLPNYKLNLACSIKWPIKQNSVLINYKTKQILFLGNLKNNKNFFYSLNFNLPKIILKIWI